MDATELVNKIESRADKGAVESIDIRLQTAEKSLKSVEDKIAEAFDINPKDEPEAELEKGMLDDFMSFEMWGIPVGQAVIGGFSAIVISELVDGFMSNQQPWQRGLVKLGCAGVAAKWGRRFLGSTGAKSVALLLAFDAVRDFTPIDSWADQLAEKITGTVTTGGLAGNPRGGAPENVNGGRSGGQSYYSKVLGG